uniref:Uncharacterized protein n=1 Tax=Russula subnigricans TaxID=258989 RepID=A0A649WI46_9AGAM|nr:hypothetical protein [Russula subnigricans]QGK88094.1 hypothetical protein [Russula subnigricans]
MNFILLIIILSITIYNLTGIYFVIPFLIAIFNFFIASINLENKHEHEKFNYLFAKYLSLSIIIIILYINMKILIDNYFIFKLTKLAYVIPVSIDRISYLKQFVQYDFFIFTKGLHTWFYFTDEIEIKKFLSNLDWNKTYVLNLELVISDFNDDDEFPVITLCEPILINKYSNSNVISKFILNQINLATNKFNLEYEYLQKMRLTKGAPYIYGKYSEIRIF